MTALLFDLDGTMLDTDPIHIAVFAEMLAPEGLEVDHAFYMENVHGRLNEDIFAEFLPDHPDPGGLSRAKEAAFRDRLPRPFPETPGLTALLDEAGARGWGVGVVTNAPRANAEAMLAAIGHRERVEALVIGEECTAGKPDPAPYRAAMEALAVAPADAIVFEDSPAGVRSGAAAGARVVGVRSSLNDATLRDAGAHETIEDFTDEALGPILARHRGTG